MQKALGTRLPTSLPPKFGRVIFIDRSLASKRLPAFWERMGFEVELHNNYFVHDEDDDKWIPKVAERKWVILSGDKRLAVEPLNKEAVRESKAQVILVSDTNSLPEQWAASIIVGRFRLQELLDRNPGPTFIKVARQAKEHVSLYKERLYDTGTTINEPIYTEGENSRAASAPNGAISPSKEPMVARLKNGEVERKEHDEITPETDINSA